MPRNIKDSDDEVETKSSGRRTRVALNPSVLDSPLRRSTRIKHPVLQDGSSPESLTDVSSVGATRSNRRRTTTGDTGIAETTTRSLRTRRNSVASDISELTETESLPDGPAKRVTRRSIAGAAAADTPPSLNGRARRATRAGSESKSTPPVGRATRRNRATSLEPEGVEEQKIREVGTPVKSRRRASVMPSEPALAEESEDSGRGSRHHHVDKTVYEIDEDGSDSGHNTSRSSRRKSKSDVNDSPEKMEVDESPVEESEGNTIERSARENTEAGANNIDSSRSLEDSSETTKPENGSSQSISRSSRSSSYTIDKLPSPSTEKHEKSPGNKENEILNASDKSSVDTRLSGRRSLETYAKSPEKRRNIVAERRSSINKETPTTPQNTHDDLKSSEKLSRKERYSVDDCVVIIEPMEIDRIAGKTSVPAESPRSMANPEVSESNSENINIEESDQKVPESNSEKMNIEECDEKLSSKPVENIGDAVIEEPTSDDGGLKISNVVSVAPNEGDEGNKDVQQERVGIVEITETEVEETREEIASQPLVEVPDEEKVSPEPSGSCVEPEIVISEKIAPNENANDERAMQMTSEPTASNIEPGISISGAEASAKSVPVDELAAANSEGNKRIEAEKSIVEEPSSEKDARSEVDGDVKSTTESAICEEKNADNVADVEKTSMEAPSSNAEAPNSEEKMDVAVSEKGSTESSSTIVESVETAFSINNEKPINSDAIEDYLLFSKGRKSSIVTESPPSGANGEEVPSVRNEKEKEEEVKDEKRRKSASNGRSSDAGETKSREIESRNDKVNERKAAAAAAAQSDEESEYDGFPAFKDIPADEWKPPKDGESNSLHSASTEVNECDSDFELALAVEVPRPSRQKDEDKARSDYDSDDTVKLAVTAEEEEETPMNVSSDAQEEDIEKKITESTSIKRASLNSSRKMNETPEKNISLVAAAVATSVKNSPASVKNSPHDPRRKSLQVDDPANESSSNSMKLNSAKKRSSLNASARLREEADSDDEPEADNTDVSTPKTAANGKKSLVASSGKKSKERTSVSAANSPTNGEKRSSNDLTAKRNRSLNKSADDAAAADADSSENSMESEVGKRAKAKSLHAELMKQLKGRLSTGGNASDGSSSVHESPAVSPKLDKSARKSNGRTDVEENESRDDQSTPKNRAANKARKSASAKNSPANLNNSTSQKRADSVIDFQDSPQSPESRDVIDVEYRDSPLSPQDSPLSPQDSPQSPEPEDPRLCKSVNIGSAKKSASRRNQDDEHRYSPCSPGPDHPMRKAMKKYEDSPQSPEPDDPRLVKSVDEGVVTKLASGRNSLADPRIFSAQYQNSPQSSEPEDSRLDKSVKIGSAKKSTSGNSSKLAEDPRLDKSVKMGSAKKSKRSSSKLTVDSDSESGDEDDDEEASQESLKKSARSASAKKSASGGKSSQLDKSVKIGSAKKSKGGNSSKLTVDSDSEPDDDEEVSQESLNKSARSASAKKSAINKNYSTIAQINSDSDVDEDVDESDDSVDVSRQIPKFLYGGDSDSADGDDNDDDSSRSIDSDVARDLNLDGKTSLEYSDDDVPADDCIATESESSDDEDDDGADMMDFVVADDEVDEEEEEDDDDDDDDSPKSSPVSAKQKPRKRIIPRPAGDEVVDEEEEDDDYEDVVVDLGGDDDDEDSPKSSPVSVKQKPRKRIIPRPAGGSDSDENDVEEPMIVSPAKTPAKTPIKATKLNKSQEIVEDENKSVDLNLSAKNVVAKNKNLLMQSSTPKTLARQSLLQEKTNSAKSTTTPTNKSLKSADSSVKIDSVSKKLSKSVSETIETPAKLSSSFKVAKTPKSSSATREQMQTSLPIDLDETVAGRINLSKAKSTKISTLNQTVVPPGSVSPEMLFLMKDKLNESMPALKVQQRARALRLSILNNLRDKTNPIEELPKDDEEISQRAAEKRASIGEEKAPSTSDASNEKKKKKKKRKKEENDETLNVSPNPEEVEQEEVTVAKKAKKLGKKKAAEPEEAKVEEMPKKKKKKKLEETIELDASAETEKIEKKNKKKRKEGKTGEAAEPEVPVIKKKSRKLAAAASTREERAQDSDDAPEAVDFTAARDAAIKDFKKMTESIKSGQEAKKKKKQFAENVSATKVKTSVKRLPDDVLANLSAVAERPKKRRKVAKDEKITFSPVPAKSGDFSVDDGYIPLSSYGGTTQFSVVNLKKAVKHSRKAVAAMTFRERMLARNPRQPVSAYMMYLQKQKGMDKKY